MSMLQKYVLNAFPLPHEVFELGLRPGPLLVYVSLIYHKSLKHGAGVLDCTTISRLVCLCEKSVRTHLCALEDAGLIQVASNDGIFTYTLCSIWDRVEKCRTADSVRTRKVRWRSTKQEWLTGEKFNAVFWLPNEVFQLGLKSGELLVYIYLQYQKGTHSGQCWPSYATIGAAVGMSRKTVQKYIGALADKGLIQTEETTIRRKNGFIYNGSLLYTLKPIRQVLKEREKHLSDQLKLAEAQRKWNEKVKRMPGTPNAVNCDAGRPVARS